MLTVSDSIKNAYNQYTTQRKSYIRVGDSSFFVQNLDVVADCYEKGNVIGNAIAKIAKFDIETNNVKGLNEFELFDGIWTGNQYEYVSLGTFKLFNEEGTDDFFSSVTAYDKLVLFNKEYNPSQTVYPTTLFELLQNVCLQAGVELENTSIPNGEQSIEENLFVENESLKLVLNAICQISGNFGIISQDKVKLLLKGTKTIGLSKYQLSKPEYKRTTWKINQVVLGMTDVEGEYVLRQDDGDIAQNGVHKLVINDNPFVYTQELREQYIDNLFNQVNGFGYIAFSTKWEGLPFVELGDLAYIDGKESIVLRYNLKSPKGLESTLEAPSIIDNVIEYVDNSNSVSNKQKRTEYLVDKANQQIEAVIQTQKEIIDNVTVSDIADGIELELKNSAGEPLVEFKLDGRSTQATRSSKNLFNYKLLNDENTVQWTAYANLGTMFRALPIYVGKNKQVYFSSNVPALTSGNAFYAINDINNGSSNVLNINNSRVVSSNNDGYVYLGVVTSRQYYTDVQNNTYWIMISDGEYDYEPYGVMPSPDFPSPIESIAEISATVTGKNLLNATYYNANNYISQLLHLKVGNYTIKYTGDISSGLYVRKNDGTTPINGTIVIEKYNLNTMTFSISEEGLYYIQFYKSGAGFTNFSNAQLEEGSVATEYEPYQSNTSTIDLQGNELCSLPNGTKDEVNITNGEALLIKKIKKVVFDGSDDEGWTKDLNADNDVDYFYVSNIGIDKNNINTVISNRFILGNSLTQGMWATTVFCITINKTYTGITSSDTTRQRIDKFKTWLSKNPVEVLYELAEPETIDLGKCIINTLKGNCTIRLISNLESSNMYCKYMRDTEYARDFATKTQLLLTENSILLEVNNKVDDEDFTGANIILAINDDTSSAEINADKISLAGKEINLTSDKTTIESNNFSVDTDGKITSTAGIIGGYNITSKELYAETFAPFNVTDEDLTKVRNYLNGSGTLTEEEIQKYDLDKDGSITPKDLLRLIWYLNYNMTTTESAKIIMSTGNEIYDNTYKLQDGAGNDILKLGFNGIEFRGRNILDQNILWEGAWFMNGAQIADLSEKVSEQPHGIVLVFSEYADGEAKDWNYSCHFVPKEFVSLCSGKGSSFFLNNSKLGLVGTKYLYIWDDHITGNNANEETGTGASGIKYTNNRWVLRAVIGV